MSRSDKEYLRFRWSHLHPVHLLLVRVFNAIMRLVPFRLKYSLGRRLRRSKPPYSLAGERSVVVQVGAPRDTLRSGRSRAIYFALASGRAGRVVVVEPDAESAALVESTARRLGLEGVTVCRKAAWSEKKLLKLYFKPSHPAAGFVEECAEYPPEQLAQFSTCEVDADSVDNILASLGIDRVDLLSVTTNGAEEQVLEGMKATLARGLPYISLARTSDTHTEMMRGLGYERFAADDRGFTFAKTG